MHSRRILIGFGMMFIAVVLIAVFSKGNAPTTTTVVLDPQTASSQTYMLETVTSSAEQTMGLSGRAGLNPDAGMLFKYDRTEKRCMWMKDMKFNIDIIWLDGNNRISSIAKDLSPATYPQTYCAEAQYVVELQSGEADKRNLRVGQIVKL